MRELVAQKLDRILAELRKALELDCTLPAIHYASEDMGLSFKKRLSMPANNSAKTSPRRGRGGTASKRASTWLDLFSWTNRQPNQHDNRAAGTMPTR
jgi:hypothetical protein